VKIVEWYVGFYRPRLRNTNGRIDPGLWFGHCELWGYTTDETWLFIDPQRKGAHVRVTHHNDEVTEALSLRFCLCDSILRLPASDPAFRLPLHGAMTCASLSGAFLGQRALLPGTLRRKLLAKGAEVIHGQGPSRRSSNGGRA
jgi:hypothetical protein